MTRPIGFYLDEPVDGVMTMPTEKSQEILDRYYSPISKDVMEDIEWNLDKLSKKEQQLDMTLADETLAFLRRNPDFEEGYQMLDEEEKAHLHLVLIAQQDQRTLDNLEYTKSFK